MPNISTGLARQLAKNYNDFKLGSTLDRHETKSIMFSRERIFEALGERDPNSSASIQGLRFYLAAYDDDHQPIPERKNKMTLVIVQVDGRGKDILDDPSAPPEYPEDGPIEQFNDGQLCPPPNCASHGLLDF